MTANSAVLEYAKPQKRRLFSLNSVVIICTAILLPLFYIALAPSISSFALDYTQKHSWWRVSRAVLAVNPRQLLSDPSTDRRVWFIPFGIVMTSLFVFFRRRGLKRAIAAAAMLFTAYFFGIGSQYWIRVPIYGTVIFVRSLVGLAGGEEWSEGIVALGIMGVWIILWLIFFLLCVGGGRNAES